MGLSADPDKRQRQLDALEAGRQAQARRWLGLDGEAPAEPGPSPGRRTLDYDEPAPAEPGPSPGAEPAPAEPEPAPAGLVERIVGRFDG